MLNYSDPATQQALINTLIGGPQPNLQQAPTASGWGTGGNPIDQAVSSTANPQSPQSVQPQMGAYMNMLNSPIQPPTTAPQTMPW